MEVSLHAGGSQRTLETVKVLHETILSLRTALESSQKELLELRSRSKFLSEVKTIKGQEDERKKVTVAEKVLIFESMDEKNVENDDKCDLESGVQDNYKIDSGTESDDIDDIELVFTTGETDLNSVHDDLVPIVEENGKSLLTNTVIAETDISKCGVADESERTFAMRRNTLPDPLPYRPIIHREILAAAKKPQIRSPCKALEPGTQEVSAQTDITALPGQWKSETYLAHKMNYNLTTLPSKFTLSVPRAKRLPLSDKTCEARRVLLSDINFTSMVPELSRSADHLHDDKTKNRTKAYEFFKLPKTERCCEYTRQESRSSCGSYYGSRCQTSSTSIPPFVLEDSRRRHSWKPPHIFCCQSKHFFWSSVPSSPIRCNHDLGDDVTETLPRFQPRRRKSKLHFHQCDPFGQSMPNLRLEPDSGESTESLLDEAEEFLRRSIDKMIINATQWKRREAAFSAVDSASGFEPPNTAQPFLPKTIKDLKRDCFVKVITPDGRVIVGRVRYSGLVPGRTEPYVGVELANDCGFSDGSFMGHHFFDCDPEHAIFVPFKKVVIAWSN